jgi:WD40 repeat protein
MAEGSTSVYTNDLAYSWNGSRLFAVGRDDMTIWDVNSGQSRVVDHRYTLRSVAASPDGRYVVTGSGTGVINVYNGKTLRPMGSFKAHAAEVLAVAFHPKGRTLVSGSRDGTAKAWDVGSGRGLLNLTAHNDYVNAVAFSPSGKLIATGGDDSRVIIWEAKTGKAVRALVHPADVHGVAFGRTPTD